MPIFYPESAQKKIFRAMSFATSPINPNIESVVLSQNVYPFTSETDLSQDGISDIDWYVEQRSDPNISDTIAILEQKTKRVR